MAECATEKRRRGGRTPKPGGSTGTRDGRESVLVRVAQVLGAGADVVVRLNTGGISSDRRSGQNSGFGEVGGELEGQPSGGMPGLV
jgi:hypothetical protein